MDRGILMSQILADEQASKWMKPLTNWKPHESMLPPPKEAKDMDIWEAAASNKLNRVRELVNAGANLEAKSENGYTVLSEAVNAECTSIVQFLLEHGANADCEDPLYGDTPLTTAANMHSTEIARLLLAVGADVNKTREIGGWAPLHLAAAGGNVEMIALLVEGGADLAQKRNGGAYVGGTPLFEAAMTKQEDACRCLVALGARVGDDVDQRRFRKHIRAIIDGE